jgi:2-polyprenyl-6-methoxyphenol hydroxylase-like FAD-dependent oxidoreductase
MSDSTGAGEFDVVIVGAGVAGCAAALTLSRQGHSVCLLDLQRQPRHAFRAEKISGEQLPLLDKLGLLHILQPASVESRAFLNIRGRRIVDVVEAKDRGVMYRDMVGLLRDALPTSVTFRQARVSAIQPDTAHPHVMLDSGERIRARLVVLATGHATGIRERLGIEKRIVHPIPTITVGFSVKPPPGGFSFASLAAYGERSGDGVDYTAIFPMAETMRVNVFVFGALSDPRITAFKTDPMAAMWALQPGLKRWTTGCAVTSAAEFFALEISTSDKVIKPGVVLIGDAFRTACSAVGNGITCLLTDVARLAVHVPAWLNTPGMGEDKIAQFYDDPIKQAMDKDAHRLALQRRVAVLGRRRFNGIRLHIHYARRHMAYRAARLKSVGPARRQSQGQIALGR